MPSIYFKGQIIEGCEKPMPDETYQDYWTAISPYKPAVFNESAYNSDLASWETYINSLPSNQKFLWKGKEGAFKDGEVVTGRYVKGRECLANALGVNCNQPETSCGCEIITLPLQQPEREQGDGTIIQFLLGSHSYEGVWFGDKHPTRKGNFWWREILKGEPVSGKPKVKNLCKDKNRVHDGECMLPMGSCDQCKNPF